MTTHPAQPRYLRSGQVAKLMGLSPKTVSRYAKEGKLPYVRTLGGHRRYSKAEIDKLLATNTYRPDEEAF
jgi:excisionase family DNA binding protein